MSLLLPAFIPPDNVLLCDSLAGIRKQLETNVLNAMSGRCVSTEYTLTLCMVFLNCLTQVQKCCHVHRASILARNDNGNTMMRFDVQQAAANVVRIWLRVCLDRQMISPQIFGDIHIVISQNSHTLVDWPSGTIIGPHFPTIQSLCSILTGMCNGRGLNSNNAISSNNNNNGNKRHRSTNERLTTSNQLQQQEQHLQQHLQQHQQQFLPITAASGGGVASPSSAHIVTPNRQSQVVMPTQNTTSDCWTPTGTTPTSSCRPVIGLGNHHHHHHHPTPPPQLPQQQYQHLHQVGGFSPSDPRSLYASNNNHINNMMMMAPFPNNFMHTINSNVPLLPPPPPPPAATITTTTPCDAYDGPPRTILAIQRVASPSSDVTP